MTTWAEFCASSKKGSQAVLSLRLRVPVGPQLERVGLLHSKVQSCLCAVGFPPCFSSEFQVIQRNSSLACGCLFWRLGMQRKDRMLWGLCGRLSFLRGEMPLEELIGWL